MPRIFTDVYWPKQQSSVTDKRLMTIVADEESSLVGIAEYSIDCLRVELPNESPNIVYNATAHDIFRKGRNE